jgi:hypothetical protein
MGSLLAGATRREPLAAADGLSGSPLERVVLAGGEVVVIKHVRAGGDWIMRATHDGGRVAELWASGILRRVPATIDHAILAVEEDGDGWAVVMRERVVLLDWGTQTGWAPPAVEVAWYLAVNASRIDATREQVLDDFRAAEGECHDEDALRLALLGGLVQLGWDKALHASGHPDPAVRAREAADLAWWTARARDALERWSPR